MGTKKFDMDEALKDCGGVKECAVDEQARFNAEHGIKGTSQPKVKEPATEAMPKKGNAQPRFNMKDALDDCGGDKNCADQLKRDFEVQHKNQSGKPLSPEMQELVKGAMQKSSGNGSTVPFKRDDQGQTLRNR